MWFAALTERHERRDDGDDHEEGQNACSSADGAWSIPEAVCSSSLTVRADRISIAQTVNIAGFTSEAHVDVIDEIKERPLDRDDEQGNREISPLLEQPVIQETSRGALPFFNSPVRLFSKGHDITIRNSNTVRARPTPDEADEEDDATNTDGDV